MKAKGIHTSNEDESAVMKTLKKISKELKKPDSRWAGTIRTWAHFSVFVVYMKFHLSFYMSILFLPHPFHSLSLTKFKKYDDINNISNKCIMKMCFTVDSTRVIDVVFYCVEI